MQCPFSLMKRRLGQVHSETDLPSGVEQPIIVESIAGAYVHLNSMSELNEQMKMIGLTRGDLELMRSIRERMEPHMDTITDRFYQSVVDVEKLKETIVQHSTIDRLKTTLRSHLLEFFNGTIDEAYVSKRLKIAQVHKMVGLEPKWYLSAFQNLQNEFMRVIYREMDREEERQQVAETMTKLLSLEQQLVLEAYEKENMNEKKQQYEQVKEELKRNIVMFVEDLATLNLGINESLEKLALSGGEVSDLFRRTTRSARNSIGQATAGETHMSELAGKISRIDDRMQDMRVTVDELNDSSRQIHNIVISVQDIAAQIKLLSLNATIEAAHAGEHGLGFGVVAKEVSRLSEDTRTTVEQIAAFVKQSRELTARAVDSIREVQSLTQQGREQSGVTSSIFLEILNAVKASTVEMEKAEKDMINLTKTIGGIGAATSEAAVSAERFRRETGVM